MKWATVLPVLLLGFIFVSSSASTQMINPYLTLYTTDQTEGLNQTVLFASLLVAITSITSFVLRVPTSILADRYGPRYFAVLGAALASAGILTFVLTKDLTILMIGRVLQGASVAIFQPALISHFTKAKPPGVSQRQLISYSTTGLPVGIGIGLAASGLLVVIGYSALFMAAFATSFVMMAVVGVFVGLRKPPAQTVQVQAAMGSPGQRLVGPSTSATSNDPPAGGDGKIFTPTFISLLFTRGGLNYVAGTQTGLLAIYVVGVLKFTKPEVALLFLLLTPFAIGGRPLSAILGSRFGDRNAVRVATVPYAVSILNLTFLPIPQLVWITQPLIGLGNGIMIPSSFVQVVESVPEAKRTQGLGYLSLAMDAGTAIGVSGAGVIYSFGGYFWAFAVAAIVAIVVFLVQLKFE